MLAAKVQRRIVLVLLSLTLVVHGQNGERFGKANNVDKPKTRTPFIPGCDLLDLAVILDSSTTIGRENFDKVLTFVQNLVANLNIGLQETRVAVIRFDRAVFPLTDFGSSTNQSFLEGKIKSIQYSRGKKRIALAFGYVGGRIFARRNGNRRMAPDVAIVFTDGLTKRHKVIRLKKRNIRVVVIPVGKTINQDKVREIASDPDEENIFTIDNVDEVIQMVRNASHLPCYREEEEEHFPLYNSTLTTENTVETEGVSCNIGLRISAGFFTQNFQNSTRCSKGTICSQVSTSIVVNMSGSSFQGKAVVGQCLEKAVCDGLSCTEIQDSFPPGVQIHIIDCNTTCCDEDACSNSDQVSPDVVVRSSNMRCFTGMRITSQIVNQNLQTLTQCEEGQVCSDFSFDIASNISGMSFSGKAVIGQCTPEAQCEALTCNQVRSILPPGLPFDLQNCDASCCKEDSCNSGAVVPLVNETETAPTNNRGSIRCFTGVSFALPFMNQDLQVLTQCPEGTICSTFSINITTNLTGGSSQGTAAIGQCIQAPQCNGLTCNQVQRFLPPGLPFEIQGCEASCCRQDACNAPGNMVQTSGTMESTQTPNAGRIFCYTGMRVKVGMFNQDLQTLTQCEEGSICHGMSLDVVANATMSGVSVSGRTDVGQCLPEDQCSAVTCSQVESVLPPQLPLEVTNCTFICCNEDSCNAPVAVAPTVGGTEEMPTSGTGIRCYTGMRISKGTVNQDFVSLTQCEEGSSCFGFVVDIVTNVAGTEVSGKVFSGRCLPVNECVELRCDDVSGLLPHELAVEVTSCSAVCCHKDSCNAPELIEPDVGGIDTSLTSGTEGIQCYTGTTRMSAGEITHDSLRLVQCEEGSGCLGFAVDIITNTTGTEVPGKIVGGQCSPVKECSELKCDQVGSLLPSVQDIEVTSCTTVCCFDDSCNAPNLVEPEKERLHCYTGMRISAGMMNQDLLALTQCEEDSACLAFTVDIVTNVTGAPEQGKAILGQCLPRGECFGINCDQVQNSFPPGVPIEVTYCNLICCHEDSCNSPEALAPAVITTDLSPTPATEGIRCYTGLRLWAATMGQNFQSLTQCGEGFACLGIAADIITNVEGIEVSGKAVLGQCSPADECHATSCDQIESAFPSMLPVEATRCTNVFCCTEELCNAPEVIVPDLTTTAVSPSPDTESIRCYTGLRISAGMMNQDRISLTQCQARSACLSLKFEITSDIPGANVSGKGIVGQCIPEDQCQVANCDLVENILPPELPVEVTKCSSTCCSEDSCNVPDAVEPTDAGTEVTLTPGTESIRCYTGMRIKAGIINQNLQTLTQCEEGLICSAVSISVVTNATGTEVPGVTAVGQCLSDMQCQSLTCEEVQSSLPPNLPIEVTDCTSTCCSEDACNGPNIDPSYVTPPRIPLFSDESTPCKTGMRYEIPSLNFVQNMTIAKQCQPGYYCGMMNATITTSTVAGTFQGRISMGLCLEKQRCKTLTCAEILEQTPDLPVTIRDCEASCCSTSECYTTISTTPSAETTSFPSDTTDLNDEETNRPTPSIPSTISQTAQGMCGFNATATDTYQFIQSPGYPRHYMNQLSCQWSIRAQDPTNRIQLDFLNFSTEICCDSLKVQENLQNIHDFRGQIDLNTTISSTNHVVLIFTTDRSVTNVGFQLRFRETTENPHTAPTTAAATSASNSQCGFDAIANDTYQFLLSPGYPRQYMNDVFCQWDIRAQDPNNRIQLDFLNFSTESCCDRLTVQENRETLHELKGQIDLNTTISSTNHVVLIFTTDGSVTNVGFQLRFRETTESPHTAPTTAATTSPSNAVAPCGFNAIVTDTEQILYSPGHPNNYGDNLNCVWTLVTQTPNSRVQILFDYFSLESCNGCDRLTIQDSNGESRRLVGTLSTMSNYRSSTGNVTLIFVSDRSVNYRGFQARYKQITSDMPIISLPNRNDSHLPVVEQAHAAIEQARSNIIGSYSAWYAYRYDDAGSTSIRDGGNDMYDGGNKIQLIPSQSAPIQVRYNQFYSFDGFDFQSMALNPFVGLLWINDEARNRNVVLEIKSNPGADGVGTISTNNGSITFEDYQLEYETFQISSAGQDPNILEVYFVIHNENAWNSEFVQKPSFEVNSDLRDIDNSLLVQAGEGNMRNALVGYVLLSRYPTSIITTFETEQVLWFILQAVSTIVVVPTSSPQMTTGVIEKPPPSPTAPSVEAPCGFNATVTDVTKTLVSPGYPSLYDNSLSCTWRLEAGSSNQRIELNFSLFSTEFCCDRLTIQDGNGETREMRGTQVNPLFLSSTHVVLITFVSDSTVNDRGFRATFKVLGEPLEEIALPRPNSSLPLVTQALAAIGHARSYIINSYSHWYQYVYDGSDNRTISDGGNDMFDSGNRISINGNDTSVLYDQFYRFDDFEFQSQADNPFVSLLWVNDESRSRNVTIRVFGNPGSDGYGNINYATGSISFGNFTLNYNTFQISRASTDPNILEVYFFVFNNEKWNSEITKEPEVTFNSNLGDLNNVVTIQAGAGSLRNVMVGYTLLSRNPNFLIQSVDIERVLWYMLQAISTIDANETSATPTASASGRRVCTCREDQLQCGGSDCQCISRIYECDQVRDCDDGTDEDGCDEITSQQMTTAQQTTSPIIRSASTKAPYTISTEFLQFEGNYSRRAIAAVRKISSNITVNITGWYSYLYDGNFVDLPDGISDGGFDMYDGGNRLYVYPTSGEEIKVAYNRSYRNEDFDLVSNAGHPFVALLWVKNRDGNSVNYTIKVEGNAGADNYGRYSSMNGRVSESIFSAEYHVFQVSGAVRDPSICEVYFLITSTQAWKSMGNYSFYVLRFSTQTDVLNNAVRLTGQPQRVMMGYTLLSRHLAKPVSRESIEQTLRLIMLSLATIPSPRRQFTGGDLDFLPSCTVSQTVESVFRCEYVFASLSSFQGPATCRNEIDKAIRCVGSQLMQCRMGGKKNKLDSLGLPFFNSKSMLSLLSNLRIRPGVRVNNEINTFCFHAPRDDAYPHNVRTFLNYCEKDVLDDLLDQARHFYYAYTWARDRMDICRAFKALKNWFINAANTRCDFDNLFNMGLDVTVAQYLRQSLDVVLDTVNKLESSSCSESAENISMDEFLPFNCS